jgi:drug/metabolite transporter (DMT)-like permease
VPFTLAFFPFAPIGLTANASPKGLLLAVVSGAVTSGLGYVVWYHALNGLTATRAAVVQLAVPVIVALGGVAFIGEPLTLSLVLSGALILGGIAIVVAGKSSTRAASAPRS